MDELIRFGDEFYVLVRKISVKQVNENMEGLKAWRDSLHCDDVLKYNEYYLMVRRVEEAEIIEEEILEISE